MGAICGKASASSSQARHAEDETTHGSGWGVPSKKVLESPGGQQQEVVDGNEQKKASSGVQQQQHPRKSSSTSGKCFNFLEE